MKAFILEKYGPPETLRMAEVEKPAPAADEVLVKVLAVSVNPAGWRSMRAKPSFSRATLGLLRPKHRILGGDIVGRVDAVGSGVTQFKPGDEVYANLLDHGSGGFAEYVSVLRRDGLAFDDSEPDSTTLSWDAEVGEVDVHPPIVASQVGQVGVLLDGSAH